MSRRILYLSQQKDQSSSSVPEHAKGWHSIGSDIHRRTSDRCPGCCLSDVYSTFTSPVLSSVLHLSSRTDNTLLVVLVSIPVFGNTPDHHEGADNATGFFAITEHVQARILLSLCGERPGSFLFSRLLRRDSVFISQTVDINSLFTCPPHYLGGYLAPAAPSSYSSSGHCTLHKLIGISASRDEIHGIVYFSLALVHRGYLLAGSRCSPAHSSLLASNPVFSLRVSGRSDSCFLRRRPI